MNCKSEHVLKGLFVLTFLSLFLPWFTFDASIMGYCWGCRFIPFFLIPTCISALFLFKFRNSTVWGILCQISMLANLGNLIFALGYWERFCNIREGFHLLDGLHTAQPGYWLSLCLHIAFYVLFQITLFHRAKEEAK